MDWSYPCRSSSWSTPQEYYLRQLAWNYLLIGYTYRQAYEERTKQVRALRAEVAKLNALLREAKRGK